MLHATIKHYNNTEIGPITVMHDQLVHVLNIATVIGMQDFCT